MNIEFLATVAVIAPDPPASLKLYVGVIDPSGERGRHRRAVTDTNR